MSSLDGRGCGIPHDHTTAADTVARESCIEVANMVGSQIRLSPINSMVNFAA
jgi:hypothetical protein